MRRLAAASRVDSLGESVTDRVRRRTAELLVAQTEAGHAAASRLFFALFVAQWLATIVLAIYRNPLTWTGSVTSIHPHVWMAFVLGSLFTAAPLYAIRLAPSAALTRHVVAAGQMLIGGLLIHVTGGRIETHFHVFGSLAILAFYRDSRVILTATVVAASDHLLRGLFFPASVYGVITPQFWRTLEHALWVVLEDAVLIVSCRAQNGQAQVLSERRAELEITNDVVELRVRQRTEEAQNAQIALGASESRYRALFDDSPAGMFRIGADGKLLFANARLLGMTKYSLAELRAKPLPMPHLLDPARSGEDASNVLLPFRAEWQRADGSPLSVSGSVRVFHGEDGRVSHADCAVEDVTERNRAEELQRHRQTVLEMIGANQPLDAILTSVDRMCNADEAKRLTELAIHHDKLYTQLAFQASHDTLTGLPHRPRFESEVASALAGAERDPFAIVWIEIDRFREINDTLGHAIGDGALQEISRRLRDAAGSRDFVARMSGEQFAVLARDVADAQSGVRLAEELIGALENALAIDGHRIWVSARAGLSLYPEHGATAHELLAHADVAAAFQRDRAKNNIALFTEEMGGALLRRKTVEREMKSALGNGEFELYYQPQISLKTADCRAIVGVEALLRWKNPLLGSVSPGEFIPIAEENGAIIAIGDWVLSEACRQGAEWRRRGFPAMRVSVNVSALQFGRPEFLPRLDAILKETGFSPSQLEVELTETSLMNNLAESEETIRQLQHRGIHLAIDDFGTGYCSLSYLHNFSAKTLKIDQSFVRPLAEDTPARAAILRAIVEMARPLGLSVVAEGVETEFQFHTLEQIGCGLAQGYLISKPLPKTELEKLLQANAISGDLYTLARTLGNSTGGRADADAKGPGEYNSGHPHQESRSYAVLANRSKRLPARHHGKRRTCCRLHSVRRARTRPGI